MVDQPIGQWSQGKLWLLQKYLGAYATIMANQKTPKKGAWLSKFSYIDAFASSGQHVDRETQEYVAGSPFRALGCKPPFDEYWFIDLNKRKLDTLRTRVERSYPTARVRYENCDANIALRDRVAASINRSTWERGLVFLDPFGLQVDFSTVEALANTEAIDIFVNFSTMGIIRNLERDKMPDARVRALLDRVVGDSKWADELYATQYGFFGEDAVSRPTLSAEHVAQVYLDRIRKLFPCVSETCDMKNSQNSVIYVLFLASHNNTAIRITNELFDGFRANRLLLSGFEVDTP